MKRALVVGIDDYPDNPLSACGSDARSVHERLCCHADGSPNFESLLVCNPEWRVEQAILRQLLEHTLSRVADQALFYFAGHGGIDASGGYLLAQDSHDGSTGIRMADVLRLANDSPVEDVTILLDCCAAGELGHLDHEEDRALIDEGLSIIAAARSTEKAVEREGGGLFTSLLCEVLDGAGANVRGVVTTLDVYAHLDESLGSWDQRPQLKAYVSRLVPLRQCEPAVSDAVLRKLSTWFPTASAHHSPAANGPVVVTNELVELQSCRAANLLEPVVPDHAVQATGSSAYRLTPLGRHYHRLALRRRL